MLGENVLRVMDACADIAGRRATIGCHIAIGRKKVPKDVALRNDADHTLSTVDYHDPPQIVLGHQINDLGDDRVGRHEADRRCHSVGRPALN